MGEMSIGEPVDGCVGSTTSNPASLESVHQRVHEHFGEVELEARRVARRLGPAGRSGVSHEDLVSWGSLGLLEAARRFDPERGVPFARFARPRVRGAMFDGLRESHEMPGRLWRARTRADEEDSRAVLRNHAQGVAGARSGGWLGDAASDEQGIPMAVARDPDPETLTCGRQLAGVVEAALGTLPHVQAEVIRRNVLEEVPLVDVAGELGLSVPRASQLRARALRRLAPRLRGLAQPDGGGFRRVRV